jgi:hypothetical protein
MHVGHMGHMMINGMVYTIGGDGDDEFLWGNRFMSPHNNKSLDSTNQVCTLALEVQFAHTQAAHRC